VSRINISNNRKYRFGGSTTNQICAYKMIENLSRLAYLTTPLTKKRSSSQFHVLKDCEIHDNDKNLKLLYVVIRGTDTN
jgi:predicted nucleotidyltransferase